MPNHPVAGNAGIASRLTIEHRWRGVPEPERSALYPFSFLSLISRELVAIGLRRQDRPTGCIESFNAFGCAFDFPFRFARVKLSACKWSFQSFSVDRAIRTVRQLDPAAGSYRWRPSLL